MASETSAVVVAVRVRPFNLAKEDPMTCTVTVPDSTTINVTDVSAILGGSSSTSSTSTSGGGGAGAGQTANSLTSPSVSSALGSYGGAASGPARHSFAFDQVFWSIPPDVLPLHAPFLSDALGSAAPSRKESVLGGSPGGLTMSRTGSVLAGVGGPASAVSTSAASMRAGETAGSVPELSQLGSTIARQLPCLQYPPEYDDQASVYAYIGPRLYEAAMAGFNACLFAYGQTGSGKSYSMIGENLSAAAALLRKGHVPDSAHGRELGIMPRLSADLFACMRQERERDEAVTYTVEVSFVELYCEKVRDLLVSAAPSGAGAAAGGGGARGGGRAGEDSAAAGGGADATTSASGAGGPTGSLRIRQHPVRGPYVEGLSHIRVRDAEGVIKYLVAGLKDRATAGTKMNDHSSRSHALLQLHITKVSVVSDDGSGAGVTTRTRTCKVNLVDLAGSERVTQSGVTGERFDEARNINLSLSTLGRVIQQLCDKQAGKRVIPAYRDSTLTWLLSDSLGGNSKTIMLATVAPSAYCYAQTLNTLRFAGVAKKVINVATVNEERQYQQVIAELRQQLVRLTLQLESGKASEVHAAEIASLRQQREELLAENRTLAARTAGATDPQTTLDLRRRVAELEAETALLRRAKLAAEQTAVKSMTALREELAASRAEVLRLHGALAKKEADTADWQSRYHNAQRATTTTSTTTASGVVSATPPRAAAASATSVASAIEASLSSQPTANASVLQEEVAALRRQLTSARAEHTATRRTATDAEDAARTARRELADVQQRCEDLRRQLTAAEARADGTAALLETTQAELTRARQSIAPAATNAQRSAEEAAALAGQLDQIRDDYLKEKQANVQLLMRVSQLEQERGQLRKRADERGKDVNELELLLLEETETSERCYLRMRMHRAVSDAQAHFARRLAGAVAQASDHRLPLAAARAPTAAIAAAATASAPPTPAVTDTPTASDAATPRAMAATANPPWELVFAQLEYECMSDEAHARAGLEQAYLLGTIRLLTHRGRVRQTEIAQLHERARELREQLRAAAEDVELYKDKAAAAERSLAEEQTASLHAAAARREILETKRQLREALVAAESTVREHESATDSLVSKLAGVQAANDELKARCAELQRIAHDAQDALLAWQSQSPSGASAPASQRESAVGGFDRANEDDTDADVVRLSSAENSPTAATATAAARARRSSVLDIKAAIQLKEGELLATRQEAQRLELQCEEYRAALGAAQAQRERELSAAADELSRAREETATLRERARQLQQANTELAQSAAVSSRAADERIAQQQAMLSTLRRSLEEETRLADACRTEAQQAIARAAELQDELAAAHEAAVGMRRQQALVDSRYAAVQAQLEELRTHYDELERQLRELRTKEPELYVMLERGVSEDTGAFLEKIRREKESLQRQRQDARQLNSELLAHIRNRNAHLRDVQRQLVEIVETSSLQASRGGEGGHRGLDSELVDTTGVESDSGMPSPIRSPVTTPASGDPA